MKISVQMVIMLVVYLYKEIFLEHFPEKKE